MSTDIKEDCVETFFEFTNFFFGGDHKREEMLAQPEGVVIPCGCYNCSCTSGCTCFSCSDEPLSTNEGGSRTSLHDSIQSISQQALNDHKDCSCECGCWSCGNCQGEEIQRSMMSNDNITSVVSSNFGVNRDVPTIP